MMMRSRNGTIRIASGWGRGWLDLIWGWLVGFNGGWLAWWDRFGETGMGATLMNTPPPEEGQREISKVELFILLLAERKAG